MLANPPTSPSPSCRPTHSIGFLCSGGDSCGMNAAVRALTRFAIARGLAPYGIHEGFQGLIDAGDKMQLLEWDDVGRIIHLGGTILGSSRSPGFRTLEGRRVAVRNMIRRGMDALVVVGGDGSLTGADILRSEWKDHVTKLVESGELTPRELEPYKNNLTIVGLVGSIDNDMGMTDFTIGALTALHRVCEALSSIVSTAESHGRCFVVEVMGRHCGWLALMAAIAAGADWVFLPERPPPLSERWNKGGEGDWEEEMCEVIRRHREQNRYKCTLVIVCEGAIDRNLRPIRSDRVKKVVSERLHLDTRVTTLGHLQRGGVTCFWDRWLATVQAQAAIEAAAAGIFGSGDHPSLMIGISHNEITRVPLQEAVALTKAGSEAIKRLDFRRAMQLRDPDFNEMWGCWVDTALMEDRAVSRQPGKKSLRVAILNCGAPCGGMNQATRTAVRILLNRGHVPLGVHDGFPGLMAGRLRELSWAEVHEWATVGGSKLGTSRDHPWAPGVVGGATAIYGRVVDAGELGKAVKRERLDALVVVGGFEGFAAAVALQKCRVGVPVVLIPATISNNVPGTEFSIGSDTALNAIIEATDRLLQSADANRRRVFVVEVMGGECGYLATMGGLAAGAMTALTPEHEPTLTSLSADVAHLRAMYAREKSLTHPQAGRLIIRNERAGGAAFDTATVANIIRREGRGLFDARTAVLGHLQQGWTPSPLDSVRAVRMAASAVSWVEGQALAGGTGLEVVGIRRDCMCFTPVEELVEETDWERRVWVGKRDAVGSATAGLPEDPQSWWKRNWELMRALAMYQSASESPSSVVEQARL